MRQHDTWYTGNRLGGLRRFAVAITVLNLLGHTVLGFEQSWAQLLLALATAYSVELLLELIDAWSQRRPLRCVGSMRTVRDFFLSAHISGLAVAMLLYANDQLWPVAFGVAVALGSKVLLRVPMGHTTRHILNPSNFGITVTLLAFPWVGIAPPYHFTAHLTGAADWVLPGLIVVSGTFVNARFTKRLPLIAAWLGGFLTQAVLRSVLLGTPVVAAGVPMTGVAFILYTFYMITDPATTPHTPRGQVVFGLAVATVYGMLLVWHVVFGLFFALTIVCLLRGLWLYAQAIVQRLAHTVEAEQELVALGRPVA